MFFVAELVFPAAFPAESDGDRRARRMRRVTDDSSSIRRRGAAVVGALFLLSLLVPLSPWVEAASVSAGSSGVTFQIDLPTGPPLAPSDSAEWDPFPEGSRRLLAVIPPDAEVSLDLLGDLCVEPGRSAERPCSPAADPVKGAAGIGATFWIGQNRYAEVLVPSRVLGQGGELLFRRSIEARISWRSSWASFSPPIPAPADADLLNPGWKPAFEVARSDMEKWSAPILPAAPASGASTSSIDHWLDLSKDGIVKVTGSWLEAQGVSLSGAIPSQLKLTRNGAEVPLYVSDEVPTGVFGSTDYFLFYGQAKTGENEDGLGGRSLAWQKGDYTDTNAYRLSTESGTRLRVSSASGAATGGADATSFPEHLHAETNDQFFVLPDPPGSDHFFWSPAFGNPSTQSQAAFPVAIANPAAGIGATVTVRVQSLSHSTHSTRALLNGVASPDPNGTWTTTTTTGWLGTIQSWTFPASAVTSTASCPGSGNAPTVSAPCVGVSIPLAATPTDWQIVDWLEIAYGRTFASDGSVLSFSYTPSGTQNFKVTGLSSNPTTSGNGQVWDVTDPALPVRLTGWDTSGSGPFAVRFATSSTGSRRFEVRSGTFLQPNALRSASWATSLLCPGDVCSAGSGASYVVIHHPSVIDPTPGSVWNQFLTHRATSRTVRVVDVQQVYDEFNSGVFDPRAIRAFLRYAWLHWDPRPAQVLLVGDGTIDYHNVTGQMEKTPAVSGWLPANAVDDVEDRTYVGYFVSDADFGDVVPGGDSHDYPELEVGRIPARTQGEAATILQKILSAETASPAGSWKSHVMHLSDRLGDEAEEPFQTAQNAVASEFFSTPPFSNEKTYFTVSGDPTPFVGPFRLLLKEKFETAPGFIQYYLGHGGHTSWGFDRDSLGHHFWENADFDSLDSSSIGGRIPFSLNFNCYTGHFARLQLGLDPDNDSLSEHALKLAGRGVIGAWAPTGLGWVNMFGPEVWRSAWQLFGFAAAREVGAVVEAARSAVPLGVPGTQTEWRSKLLLGDPASRLPVPRPPTPTGFTGSAGPRRADLAWTAPPDVSGYRVYRSTDGGLSWNTSQFCEPTPCRPIPIVSGLVTGTSWTDSAVSNLATYWYRVSAVDADGFESSAAPAISVIPENATPPPAPTSLVASDTGAASVRLAWTAPPVDDLSRYRITWCREPCSTTSSFEIAAPASSAVVSSLVVGEPHRFWVEAKNDSNRYGAAAGPVTATPTQTDGDPLPAMVTSLKIHLSGNDLVLDWSAPTTDFRGNATTIASWRIYRTTRLPFTLSSVPASSPPEKLVLLGDPATRSWTDVDAAVQPEGFFYVVLGVTAAGLPSSASSPAPAPVRNLRLRRSASTGSGVDVDWDPVTASVTGSEKTIVSYSVFQATDPDFVCDRLGSTNLRAEVAAGSTCDDGHRYCDSLASPEGDNITVFFHVVAVDPLGNAGP
jgi:hypothetical protein